MQDKRKFRLIQGGKQEEPEIQPEKAREAELEERLERIRNSVSRINELMQELRGASRQHEWRPK